MKNDFPILSLSRGDFECLGYDSSTISDEGMQDVADELANILWGGDVAHDFLFEKANELGLKETT